MGEMDGPRGDQARPGPPEGPPAEVTAGIDTHLPELTLVALVHKTCEPQRRQPITGNPGFNSMCTHACGHIHITVAITTAKWYVQAPNGSVVSEGRRARSANRGDTQ